MKLATKLSFFLLWFAGSSSEATPKLNYDEYSDDFGITFSDDGLEIELPFFLLQLYDTDGDLPEDSTYKNIQKACDTFLLAEINAIYSPQHTVDEVNTTAYSDHRVVLDQRTNRFLSGRKPSRREILEWEEKRGSIEYIEDEIKFLRGKRRLDETVGSELLMKMNVTFGTLPIPAEVGFRRRIVEIMQNLDNLVSNLTATGDPELQDVHMAIRKEVPTFSPSSSPSIEPTSEPTSPPTFKPTSPPTFAPTFSPTSEPTFSPTSEPTSLPTSKPTSLPTSKPTSSPIAKQTSSPSAKPTSSQISNPTVSQPEQPSQATSLSPSGSATPTSYPTPVEKPIPAAIKQPANPVSKQPENEVLMYTLIAGVAATVLALTGLLIFRSRKRSDDSEKGIFEEIEEESAANQNSLVYDTRSVADDSIFSGLTDIVTETGSPRLRTNKSMSSATTVKANNQKTNNFKSPTSMATSTLFAFSEEEEDDISESEQILLSPNGSGPSSNSALQLIGPPKSLSAGQDESLEREDVESGKSNGERVPPTKKLSEMGDSLPYNLEPITPTAEGAIRDGSVRSGALNKDNKEESDENYKKETIENTPDGAFPSIGSGQRYIFSMNGDDELAKSPLFSPSSRVSRMSSLSGDTPNSKASDISESRQLINDLVWLEKKIADVRSSTNDRPASPLPELQHADSLSYKSMDAPVSPSSHGTTSIGSNGIMQNIVCRDCFAPPGKLQIVIHSTKDGPAVHTVKKGSSLEGHIFAGDLIIALDNVDTRTFTAEQVMKAMAAKSGFERKITVLHYEG